MLVCPVCGVAYGTGFTICAWDAARLVEEDEDTLVAHLIDHYLIESRIGEGTTGRIYRARDIYSHRDVALKILYGEYTADAGFLEFFQKRVELTSKIRHANVVAVRSFDVSPEGQAFAVMEHLAGTTLAQAPQMTSSSEARTIEIVRQMALGLDALHSADLVHGDLKPSSVMLVPESETERVVLIDVAISTTGGARAQSPRVARSSRRSGAPLYMSPEQICEGRSDAKSDLYALGAILYELLTGSPPFLGDVEQILHQHIFTPAPALEAHGPLGALAADLLQKSPMHRPESARIVVERLDQIAHDGGREDDARRGQKRRAGLLATVIAGSVIALGVHVFHRWTEGSGLEARAAVPKLSVEQGTDDAHLGVTDDRADRSPRGGRSADD
jgi:serine/threonine-protein kinase